MYTRIATRRTRRMNGCLGCFPTSTRRMGDTSGDTLPTVAAPYGDSGGISATGSKGSSGSTVTTIANDLTKIFGGSGSKSGSSKPAPSSGGNVLASLSTPTLVIGGIAGFALLLGLTR